jgi:hypothetical protein
METLHEQFSLVHRDLKPRNVLVSKDDLKARITDLGIGKVLQDEVAETVVGTPGYIAPETYQGASDFRSDIYSFGNVLFRLLTAQDPRSRRASDPGGAPTLPSSVNPLVPSELDALVERCLELDPRRRYQSFGEVREALEAIETPPVDVPDYRCCDAHGYHYSTDPRIGGCIFCHHERRAKRRVAWAQEEKTRRASEIRPETRRKGDADAAESPTMATILFHPEDGQVVPVKKGISPLLVIAAVVMAFVVGGVWFRPAESEASQLELAEAPRESSDTSTSTEGTGSPLETPAGESGDVAGSATGADPSSEPVREWTDEFDHLTGAILEEARNAEEIRERTRPSEVGGDPRGFPREEARRRDGRLGEVGGPPNERRGESAAGGRRAPSKSASSSIRPVCKWPDCERRIPKSAKYRVFEVRRDRRVRTTKEVPQDFCRRHEEVVECRRCSKRAPRRGFPPCTNCGYGEAPPRPVRGIPLPPRG